MSRCCDVGSSGVCSCCPSCSAWAGGLGARHAKAVLLIPIAAICWTSTHLGAVLRQASHGIVLCPMGDRITSDEWTFFVFGQGMMSFVTFIIFSDLALTLITTRQLVMSTTCRFHIGFPVSSSLVSYSSSGGRLGPNQIPERLFRSRWARLLDRPELTLNREHA